MSAIDKMREEAKTLDAQIGRAAALHNMNEYQYLRGKRNGIGWCLELLAGKETA